ncbi:MAG TPA: hypothetical protein VH855_03340, partial [Acetobacteraceae bacterium]
MNEVGVRHECNLGECPIPANMLTGLASGKSQNLVVEETWLAKHLQPADGACTGCTEPCMSQTSSISPSALSDPVSDVLKWILLAVAVLTFGLMGWATYLTYERAPPQPERFVDTTGAPLMTADDILAGKAGFQKADLMDYGSLYGMGSYYGQDYTAWTLIRLAGLVEGRVAQAQFGKPFEQLAPDQQAAVRDTMRGQLQRVDLTQQTVKVPDALAAAIVALRGDITKELAATDLETGWTPAYSLGPDDKARTADFLIYSALTTVARRPDVSWSWT